MEYVKRSQPFQVTVPKFSSHYAASTSADTPLAQPARLERWSPGVTGPLVGRRAPIPCLEGLLTLIVTVRDDLNVSVQPASPATCPR